MSLEIDEMPFPLPGGGTKLEELKNRYEAVLKGFKNPEYLSPQQVFADTLVLNEFAHEDVEVLEMPERLPGFLYNNDAIPKVV